jgi:hypothetical protein
LPGYDGLRVPARFAMLGTLGIAMAAGIGAARLSMLVGRWTPVLGVMAAAGLVADGLTHDLPVASAPGRIALEKNLRPAVIEIPIDNLHVSVGAMYRSAFHRQPTVNGYSGHIPPHYFALSLSLWHGDSSPLIHLARRRPLVIIVNENVDPGAGFRGMVEALPGIMHLGTGAGGSMFLLPQQPWGRPPPTGGPTHPFVVNDRGRALLEFDLGAARDLMALEFPLRKRWEDLSPRLRVEASDDGQGWREAWMGWTGGLALDAILADPLVAPIQIPLAGVRARYLRVYPAPSWMKSELAVH